MDDQLSLFESLETRTLLDRLLEDSRLYSQSKDYKELLDFVVRLPNIAPFNAMLLQIQKPGLKFAMSKKDWRERFGRFPKDEARPLLIMWPFGPVGFVYDELDTEGEELAEDVRSFVARGPIYDSDLDQFKSLMAKKKIEWYSFDAGDNRGGWVAILKRSEDPKVSHTYRIAINSNHSAPTRFATLVHELGHLFLGHLGPDAKLKIKDRSDLSHQRAELEAESVSYIVCLRSNVETKAKVYLSNYVQSHDEIDLIDIYGVMKAAGSIESLLKLNPKAYDSMQ